MTTSTALERLAIDGVVNLSDGHARQPLTHAEQALLARLPRLYGDATRTKQSNAEREFAEAYFTLAAEPPPADLLFSYSTSCLVALIAEMFVLIRMVICHPLTVDGASLPRLRGPC